MLYKNLDRINSCVILIILPIQIYQKNSGNFVVEVALCNNQRFLTKTNSLIFSVLLHLPNPNSNLNPKAQ